MWLNVRFDDRLLTVLNQPAGDRHDAAVRWRQLVDLVARAGPGGSSPVIAQALESIRTHAPEVEEKLRAAAARAVAGRPLPAALLEYFASDRLNVSAPVLAAANLEPPQWRALVAMADEETRRFVEALHPGVTSAAPADAKRARPPRRSRMGPRPRPPSRRRRPRSMTSSRASSGGGEAAKYSAPAAFPRPTRRCQRGCPRYFAGNAGQAVKLRGSRARRAGP
jgi:hypothetical protein